MFEQKFITHRGYMSASLSKEVALNFAFAFYSLECTKIPVLLEITLAH